MPVTLSPSHVPALHSVPFTYWRQAPLPSQVPSCPQVAGVLAAQVRGSCGFTPEGTTEQSPRELGRSQAMQVAPQAEVQQSPSTQNNPVWHSPSQLQDSAFPLDLLSVPDEQALGWPASAAPGTSFPPSCVPPPPPSRPMLTYLLFAQPAAPKTAHRARAPQKTVAPLYDDVEP